ncbi:MAG: glucosidase [Acidobacteria bacterium]|nr:glucosidase [Acidobacteriota bacterium]
MTKEEKRLEESRRQTAHWKRWGPYLAERAWGTVREDYSPDGSAWEYFPHDEARSKAYRWNEDGLGGICDRRQYICFAVALWNGRDPILKERLYGLTGPQGNHGEDVKEHYFYLDSTPTHSYMKFLYKYPQSEFPYERLLEENRRRDRHAPEFEIMDTGIFDEDRYFDVFVEYAKGDAEDILIKISVTNQGNETARLHLLPTLWFRNTWSWDKQSPRPRLLQIEDETKGSQRRKQTGPGASVIEIEHEYYGARWLYCEDAPELLFTENETNIEKLYGAQNPSPYVKDGINNFVVHDEKHAVNPERVGTKAAAKYVLNIAAGETATVRLRFTDMTATALKGRVFGASFEKIFDERRREADEFYAGIIPNDVSEDTQNVMRQSLAGLLWSKQYYHYVVKQWLDGDPAQPPPPPERRKGRNHEWDHLYNSDVVSMPDKWEYPWYAAWDLAFHCIPLSIVDSDFAKEQLILILREWYMHPNGQLPAYEWALGDVNPPVHAWAALRVYRIEKKRRGVGDRAFLERVFHKLLLNFTWWVNRKDTEGNNIFEGGFLGLDNIGVFDRSKPLPTGGYIEQSDGTSWMAMYTLNLLEIALELANEDPVYEDVASKFWEHFIYIAHAMNNLGHNNIELWDEEDGFYYDVLHQPDGTHFRIKLRSMVGLIPLFAVGTLEPEVVGKLKGFERRLEWFVNNRPDLTGNVASVVTPGRKERRLLSILDEDKLRRILKVMLDEEEFFSPYGIRALSRFHKEHPYKIRLDGTEYRVDYEPAESSTGLFGGNSNWRGPVWFPVNYLIIESLQKFHYYLGDDYKVECPTGSGRLLNLWEVAGEISRRLSRIFLRDESGRRPVFGDTEKFQTDPRWKDYVPFYEYFHGDTGAGLGASHQTGWTGLVAKLIQQSGE